jgi:hypothetical protein
MACHCTNFCTRTSGNAQISAHATQISAQYAQISVQAGRRQKSVQICVEVGQLVLVTLNLSTPAATTTKQVDLFLSLARAHSCWQM